ncbi:MAG: crossover junction endodeoxyribonuclease RuvC, partial [Chloroflexi bacterium]|nr:crossover junction endodeoxyribonuclease RuvC [Chloroflexota bacterium]
MSSDRDGLIVLGIDPGISVTGYGIISSRDGALQALDFGAWRLPERQPLPERLRRLHESVAALIGSWRPREIAVEDFIVGHARAAVTVGEARAMVLLAAAQAGLPVYLYKPLEVKQFVTSYGRG